MSEDVASKIEFESSMQNLSISELLRRGAAIAIMHGTAKADIDVHFPEGTELTYALTITAQAPDGTCKDFAFKPNINEIGGSHVEFIGEYKAD